MNNKIIYIDPTQATLQGYDLEMNKRVQEAIENLICARACVLYQYQAEAKLTKKTLFEVMLSEVQIYIDFSKDIEKIALGIKHVIEYMQEYDKKHEYDEVELKYPKYERKHGG